MKATKTLVGSPIASPAAPSPARHGGCKKHRNRRAACPLPQLSGRGIFRGCRDTSIGLLRMTVSAVRAGKSAIIFTTNYNSGTGVSFAYTHRTAYLRDGGTGGQFWSRR